MIQPVALAPVDCLLIWRRSGAFGPWWWRLAKRWWVDPERGHVTVALFDPAAPAWLVIDSTFGGITVRALPPAFGPRDVLAQFPDRTAWAVLPDVSRDHVGYTPRGLITCVSVVKAVTGLRGWCITPQGLFRQIERMAADGHGQAESGQVRREGAKGRGEDAESRGGASRCREEPA